jgi:DNA-binding PadR family transcriptional regulator
MPDMSAPDESGTATDAGQAGTDTSRAANSGRARADAAGALETLGRSSGPASLILSSLADGPKHGYALTKDIEAFAGVRLAPGTLYEALSRLESHRMIEAVESNDRRRPYRLTATGATALSTYLESQRKVAEVGLRRLAGNWALT